MLAQMEGDCSRMHVLVRMKKGSPVALRRAPVIALHGMSRTPRPPARGHVLNGHRRVRASTALLGVSCAAP